ncbi:D-2-hydroxyglutarate dehydrogenase, mitochondrial [Cimex lectularius]|uniref:D-2-hydroxyglutarate dehydrogenase, mitochondrial n=1 Tax=Cimex lectularius TaxID=79782 RepID=A0A8I6RDE4_CIMLE|nr:D-2-hydroxyglutarate dehydrogenase, mitochondrial [Cimex lectularius]
MQKITKGRFFSTVGFFTKDRYQVKRGDFGYVTDKELKEFESILGKDRVLTDENEVSAYNVDWLKTVAGEGKVVLKPKTVEEVSQIMKTCHRSRIAVCPQGGKTGLVGGSVPVFDEVIISTSLMNKIYDINQLGGTVKCDSGCILESLDEALADRGMMMPLDLGAKGSCQIGGNISTSAGGLRLLRYGTMQANTLGLEVVLADGTILNMLNSLRKDNTGYHLRQLFIGSEGTLGLVTKAVIQCPVRPKSVNLSFLGLPSYDAVLATYRLAKDMLSETLSSCEMIDTPSFESVLTLGLKSPLSSDYPFYMLIETHGSSEEHDSTKMTSFLERCMEEGHVLDGTFSNEPSRMHNIWQLRERIAESMAKNHYIFKYDITLPLEKFYEVTRVMKEHMSKFGSRVEVTGFGHLGDGNMHLNLLTDKYDPEVEKHIEPFIFEWTASVGGSISAEHGIGFKKAKYLHYSKSTEAIALMRHIKGVMDPKGILNPYKVLA